MVDAVILDELFAVLQQRVAERPAGSYVTTLAEGGLDAVAAKLREETEELVEAAGGDDATHVAHEAADLLFHAWVLLAMAGVSPDAVYGELRTRFGVGGLVEKAARSAPGGSGEA